LARGDKFTATGKIPEFFSDFTINLSRNPVTGNLAKITNEESVKTSIRNIILTGNGERPYRPNLGSKIKALLFEPMDDVTAAMIQTTVETAIKNHEPRADLVGVQVNPDYGQNRYMVTVLFTLINIPGQTFDMAVFLKRVR